MRVTKLNELIRDDKVIKGRWELTGGHEVRYRAESLREELELRGSLIAAEPRALVISLNEVKDDKTLAARTVKLSGQWKANARNQLQFEAVRQSGRNDVLTLKAGWDLNDRNEIVYSYRETQLKTRSKTERYLTFSGYWDFDEHRRLTYRLEADSESAFSFRGALQTTSIYAKKGEIRYQLGIQAASQRRQKTITLFGKWKLSRDLDLSFEVDHAERGRAIQFGCLARINDHDEITVELRTHSGRRLGAQLIWTKDILSQDAQVFVRLSRLVNESRLEAGYKRRF